MREYTRTLLNHYALKVEITRELTFPIVPTPDPIIRTGFYPDRFFAPDIRFEETV